VSLHATATPQAAGTTDGRAPRRSRVDVSISFRTILVVAATVAVVAALVSIRSVVLLIFVSVFSVAVLSPVATWLERRLGWSRRLASIVLVLALVVVVAGFLLVMVAAVADAVHGFSQDLPQIVDQARHSGLGDLVDKGHDEPVRAS
jgi:predicted PurR-regulated permease PerM